MDKQTKPNSTTSLPFMNKKQMAAHLGISTRGVEGLMAARKIPYYIAAPLGRGAHLRLVDASAATGERWRNNGKKCRLGYIWQ